MEGASELNEKLEQREAEIAVINSVQQGILAKKEMQEIYDLVGEKIRTLFDAQVAVVSTFDYLNNSEVFHYIFEDGKRHDLNPRPIDQLRQRLINTGKLILINENIKDAWREITGEEQTVAEGTKSPKSVLFVPMVIDDVVKGYISLQNLQRENAFQKSDVQFLTTLVNSLSVALESAHLFSETSRLLVETEQRATELQTVNRISQALVSKLEFDALINLVGELMKKTFKADIVYVALFDRKRNSINFPYEYGDQNESRKFSDGLTEKIIKSNQPLLINKDLDEIREQLRAQKIGKVVSSFLGVPIPIGDKPTGVISVQSTEEENRFNENDQRLLSTIAANVGVAMQNSEAYEKLRSALTDLKAAQEQLVQQEKLASLGQLTAGIAHEIKNPLNFVNNFSELSVELVEEMREEVVRRKTEVRGPKSEKGKTGAERQSRPLGVKSEKENSPFLKGDQWGVSDLGNTTDSDPNPDTDLILDILDDIEMNLKKIHEHGSRADSIVKSMLQHSRGGSGKLEPSDLNALIKEYVNLCFHGMRAGKNPINVEIDLQMDESINDVPIITEDFSRVLVNLCNNAFDAMREKLTVDGKPKSGESYDPQLTVRTHQEGKIVTIEIEDNGPGIPEEMKDKILQPFFTTKKGTDGTGLGLSITNDIIKAHGGDLIIQSDNDVGTTFIIKLTI